MNEPTKREPKTQLDRWMKEGIPLYYVRFHQPVPPAKDMEPVSEFRTKVLSRQDEKYFVDSALYTEYGVIFRCKGEVDIVPLANVIYTRLIV